jgi:hydrogenase maturation protease
MDLTLIIGFGSLLRGDDAVGPLAAERLRELCPDPNVEIRAVHQLTPELVEAVSRTTRVIFIDASVQGEPGEIRERPITAEIAAGTAFTHHVSPEGLLAAARTLYGKAPEACLISCVGGDFSYSIEPSVELQRRVEAVAKAVLRKLSR